jgi:hypothetical protein
MRCNIAVTYTRILGTDVIGVTHQVRRADSAEDVANGSMRLLNPVIKFGAGSRALRLSRALLEQFAALRMRRILVDLVQFCVAHQAPEQIVIGVAVSA